ncbi:MAG: ATP-grasp domain-containing protein [Chloroflexi bacterium]|nr:ATP-grasp domain-containing protein [Chloroflexota bacterium]
MRGRIAIAYNQPHSSRYDALGEEKAVLSVLQSVDAVHQSLVELGYEVTLAPLVPPAGEAGSKLRSLDVDLVFNLFEGFCGQADTEALVPETLAELGIPCTGCPAAVLRLALDKARVKTMLQAAGFRTPDFQLLSPATVHQFHLSYPCIVKPCSEDASHGLSPESLVNDFLALERQVKAISASYGGEALVERFIDGREFNATALGDASGTVLPISEIVYSLPPGMPRILTFAAKWESGSLYFEGTRAVCPAEVGAEEREQVAAAALGVFRLLGCCGYARVDMRLDQEGRLNILEMNPNPDISPGNGAARQAEATGMTYTQFIEKILLLAGEGNSSERQDSSHGSGRQAKPGEDITQYARV